MGDRHQFRANWHNYNAGVYFITICCANKQHYFGEIIDGFLQNTEIGKIAQNCIKEITSHLSYVEIWNYVVMPNHVHMVVALPLEIDDHEVKNMGCLNVKRHNPPKSQDFHHNSKLAIVIGQYKSSVSRLAKELQIPFAWQSRYYDNIIRTKGAFNRIMEYIDRNVEYWSYDCFNSNYVESEEATWPWNENTSW